MLYEARGTKEQRPYIILADVVGRMELSVGTYPAGGQDHVKRAGGRVSDQESDAWYLNGRALHASGREQVRGEHCAPDDQVVGRAHVDWTVVCAFSRRFKVIKARQV